MSSELQIQASIGKLAKNIHTLLNAAQGLFLTNASTFNELFLRKLADELLQQAKEQLFSITVQQVQCYVPVKDHRELAINEEALIFMYSLFENLGKIDTYAPSEKLHIEKLRIMAHATFPCHSDHYFLWLSDHKEIDDFHDWCEDKVNDKDKDGGLGCTLLRLLEV